MPRAALSDAQQHLLQAGAPPSSSDFAADPAWWAAQNSWYAKAVPRGSLPAPPSAARRKPWQQATKR